MEDAIIVREWGAEEFHRRVLALEKQGYISRRETYTVLADINPDSGAVVHLHTMEMYRPGGAPVDKLIRESAIKGPRRDELLHN